MKFNSRMLLLYAVTDRKTDDLRAFYDDIEKALQGGVTILQLREKNLNKDEFIKEAEEVKKICRRYNVPFIIDDNVEVALLSGADGVHVGIEDEDVGEIRKKVPADFIIGATAKTPEQARHAEKCGADYLGVGAVFPSKTKKNAVRITNEQLKNICASVKIPAVAIGGITEDNILSVKGSGVKGAAVVSAIFSAENIKSASERLKKKAEEIAYD